MVFAMFTLIVALDTTAAAAPQTDASKLKISAPSAVAEIDVGKLKGDLIRLAWSPDATQIYLQTAERDSRGNVKLRHYVMALDGTAPKAVDQEPGWASAYWAWKSTQVAPGSPSWKIQVEQQQKRVTPTSMPAGGNLARGDPGTGGALGSGMGISVDEAARATEQGQMASVYTLRLKGEVIGEFVNTPAMPGLTFGWGPAGSGLIAFANPDGRVVIMDDQGRKQEIPSSKSSWLPAWTGDGARLAFLERTGRKKAVLRVALVTTPTP